jgi:hypothetical protein
MSQPPHWPPQPGGPSSPYSPYPPYGPGPLRSVNGGLILALGLLGLLVCNLLGPVAAVLGGNAVAAIDRGEADPNERGSANAGRILGIISTVFLALSVLLVVIAVASPDFRAGFARGFEKSYHSTAPNP